MHFRLSPTARRRTLLTGLLVFVVLALFVHAGVELLRQKSERQLRGTINDSLNQIAGHLQTDLNANLYVADGLRAMITGMAHLSDDDIDNALRTYFRLGRHLRNIAVAPDNRVTHVYPLTGNEKVIGLYYPAVPEQWRSIQRAMLEKRTLVSGPVTLAQGGEALISRTPVFYDDGRYWGVISLVVHTAPLFAKAGVAEERNGIRFAVRGKDGRGADGACILGDCSLFSRAALTDTVEIPGGHWQVAALPDGGWRRDQRDFDYLEIAVLGIAILLSVATVGYQRGRLRIEYNARRLQAVLGTASDGIVVIDQQGMIEEFNPGAERLFGYPAAAILGTPVTRLMGDEDAVGHPAWVAGSRHNESHQMARGREINGRRSDGTPFPIEVTIGRTEISGRTVFVGVLRDISERKAMEQRLTELATRDSLTGVANRRAIMATLEQQIKHAIRYNRPLSLLMIDADHFKQVNDRHGHQNGDRVLVSLATSLAVHLRQTDRLGRFGGEEFIAVLPETDGQQAFALAERLRAAIAALSVPQENAAAIHFTVSIGIATGNSSELTTDSLLESADKALYAAKAAGRNCVFPSPSTN